jgi:hypothetical protein
MVNEMCMNTERAVIVGDKFGSFANDACLTPEKFFRMSIEQLRRIRHILVGQGISADMISRIYAFLHEHGLLTGIEVEEYVSDKVSPELVHKKFEKNVMITTPCRNDTNVFEAHLVIDESCAELSDHIAGIHIQGGLLIEAARQTFMACTSYLCEIAGREHKQVNYILKQIEVNYRQLLYPLPIRILLSINDLKALRNTGIHTCEVKVRFEQLGVTGVELTCKGMGYDKQALEQQEEMGATRMYDRLQMTYTNESRIETATSAVA